MRTFADEIDFKLELDPEVVKETLIKGLKDMEKNDGSYKIRPIFINDEEKYSPLSPYENCKHVYNAVLSHFLRCLLMLVRCDFIFQCMAGTRWARATLCT